MGNSFYRGLPKVVLASGSPRRADLLRGMGVDFEVARSEIDEQEVGRGVAVEELPLRLARSKAESVAARCVGSLVVGADTVVALDGEALHKPNDFAEACARLHRLSGREHRVLTGVCLSYKGESESFSECTYVCFRKLLREEIEYYVSSYRPYDKAGGYGIQEWIGLVGVSRVTGSYTNVVGLPTEALGRRLLRYVELGER